MIRRFSFLSLFAAFSLILWGCDSSDVSPQKVTGEQPGTQSPVETASANGKTALSCPLILVFGDSQARGKADSVTVRSLAQDARDRGYVYDANDDHFYPVFHPDGARDYRRSFIPAFVDEFYEIHQRKPCIVHFAVQGSRLVSPEQAFAEKGNQYWYTGGGGIPEGDHSVDADARIEAAKVRLAQQFGPHGGIIGAIGSLGGNDALNYWREEGDGDPTPYPDPLGMFSTQYAGFDLEFTSRYYRVEYAEIPDAFDVGNPRNEVTGDFRNAMNTVVGLDKVTPYFQALRDLNTTNPLPLGPEYYYNTDNIHLGAVGADYLGRELAQNFDVVLTF